MLKKKSLAAIAITLGLIVMGPISSASAAGPGDGLTTPDADAAQGTTLCGAYQNKGTGYTYKMGKDIPISSAGWGRLYQNDPYGLKVADNIWAKTKTQLGSVFPLHNYTDVTYEKINTAPPNGGWLRTNNNLNKAMNNLTCGSTFHLGFVKSLQSDAAALHSDLPAPGHFKVIEVRSNGVSFIGIDGVMKDAVMNFRIVSGASKTWLNVHTTGPKLSWGSVEDTMRNFMEGQAGATWQEFANKIGQVQ
ncbi:hypothetical protein UM93_01200 [Psychromicrobium lacuslunae]|uniref:Uncharacterized protein n=2 Tax=Psychromicrobium lacuslunae TaxID=1618207 RepID=A0A0D4BWL5_9MICC|nr:hypothetical protein UM93_01200 [Psychromicrobium lacuslunae]